MYIACGWVNCCILIVETYLHTSCEIQAHVFLGIWCALHLPDQPSDCCIITWIIYYSQWNFFWLVNNRWNFRQLTVCGRTTVKLDPVMSLCLYTFSYRKQEILGIFADYSATAKLKTAKKCTRPEFWKSPLATENRKFWKSPCSPFDHCLYRKQRLCHCCSKLALCFIVDFDCGRCHLKKEVWQSFGRGVASKARILQK